MSDYFDRVERQIVQRVEGGVPRTARSRVTLGSLAVAASVIVVIVVVGVFLAAGGSGGGTPSPAAHPAVRLSFTASPADPRAIDRSVRLLSERLHTALPGAQVTRTGDGIAITLSRDTPGARSRVLALTAPGRIAFYDWESDAITPSGKTVAAQLRANAPTALEISQGNGGAAAGSTGAGCVTVQQALALAERLGAGAPPRTEYAGVFVLPLPTGFEVVQATDATTRDPGVYLLRGAPALTNADIANPRASRDPNAGIPTVTFGFTPAGKRAFQALTKAVSERGSLVSRTGETLNQHFAIAVDNKLITVPFIDFKQYPNGINGNDGADMSGSLTTQSAKDLATLLRYGPLPVQLTATG